MDAHIALRARARRLGVAYDLGERWLLQLLRTRRCVYCLCETRMPGGRKRPDTGTFDRVDPRVGYVRSNVVLACDVCNARKRDFTPPELRQLADLIEIVRDRAIGDALLPGGGS